MSIKLNWAINYSFSKTPSAVFSRWIGAVLRKPGYSKGMFSSDVFGRHLLNLKRKKSYAQASILKVAKCKKVRHCFIALMCFCQN